MLTEENQAIERLLVKRYLKGRADEFSQCCEDICLACRAAQPVTRDKEKGYNADREQIMIPVWVHPFMDNTTCYASLIRERAYQEKKGKK